MDETEVLKAEFAEKEAQLYREIGQLTTQLTLLKKKSEGDSFSRNERIAIMELTDSKHSVVNSGRLTQRKSCAYGEIHTPFRTYG